MKFISSLLLLILFFYHVGATSAELSNDEKMLAVQRIEIIDKKALMIGMGLTQLLNDDFYIGAFYLDENVQYDGGDGFLFLDVTRRMEFRIASSNGISGRSFGRKLAEGIRINNSRKEVDDEKDKLSQLMRVFKGNYEKGDVVQFDYHNNFGTRVTLNGKVLVEIPLSNDLYKLIVKIWVGDRPPTAKFKEGITGRNEGAYAISLLRKYIAL